MHFVFFFGKSSVLFSKLFDRKMYPNIECYSKVSRNVEKWLSKVTKFSTIPNGLQCRANIGKQAKREEPCLEEAKTKHNGSPQCVQLQSFFRRVFLLEQAGTARFSCFNYWWKERKHREKKNPASNIISYTESFHCFYHIHYSSKKISFCKPKRIY